MIMQLKARVKTVELKFGKQPGIQGMGRVKDIDAAIEIQKKGIGLS